MDPGLGVIGAAPILAGGGVVAVIARSGAGSNLSNLRELIRMDYSGKTLSRTRLDNVQEQTFAMTGDGNLYRCDNLPGAPSYRFDPAAQNWQQIAKDNSLKSATDVTPFQSIWVASPLLKKAPAKAGSAEQ